MVIEKNSPARHKTSNGNFTDFSNPTPAMEALVKKIIMFNLPIGKKSMISALKVKRFQPNFAIFFAHFFANSENASKSKKTFKFRQEMLNILSTLNFM